MPKQSTRRWKEGYSLQKKKARDEDLRGHANQETNVLIRIPSGSMVTSEPNQVAFTLKTGALCEEQRAAGERIVSLKEENMTQTDESARPKPLRLWPGVVAVVVEWLLFFGGPRVAPDAIVFNMFGGLFAGLLVIVWWAFFSRASQLERWGAIGLAIVGSAATFPLIDKSIATGLMGMMFIFYSIPTLTLGLVIGGALIQAFRQRLTRTSEFAVMAVTILLACGVWTAVRTDGIYGDAKSDFHLRWTKTHEQQLVEQAGPELAALPTPPPAAPQVASAVVPVTLARLPATATPAPITASITRPKAEWPGFRGPGRDSIIPGTRIETNWSATPPVQLWRRPIGPGWSSFAVGGDLIYTQEQRGDDEIVACYNASTGKPVWVHRDAARFWESNGGAGPRGTPTLDGGRVYAFGATGILNAMDAGNGALLWSRNVGTDTSVKVPGWGFASSPLVYGGMVIVAASGHMAAYDAANGTPRWSAPTAGGSYSSPHLATIAGVDQILLLGGQDAISVAPADGKLLWKSSWPTDGVRIMQPAVTTDGDVLFSGGDGMGGSGIRRIGVTHSAAGWNTETKWTSNGLKPSFNDFVIHDGYVFGFDGTILSCIDLKDGARKWKGGRYGAGQLVLLRDQSLLLVLSEEGEVALVKATPDQFTEVARFKAMDEKTWNHPVLAGDRLLVRNGEEMVAYRIAVARQ